MAHARATSAIDLSENAQQHESSKIAVTSRVAYHYKLVATRAILMG